ncbi:MAG: hypothetical protein IKN54_00180, partial [Lachnospiraceae bacterium]|nr:hypothetical protein [Lachnospiraceae bacterium]
MTKFTNKIIAFVCALALVISSLNITTSNDVSAAVSDAINYEWGDQWIAVNNAAASYAQTIKAHVVDANTNIVEIQGDGIYHTFGDASFGDFTINGEVLTEGVDYTIQGASAFLKPSSLEYKFSEYIVYNGNGGIKAR